ncbi:MAG: hypothetical protein ABIR96_03645 [Bdellovibrionota bacterium]
MKVREFWNSLPNQVEMRNKIKSFKETKRRTTVLQNFENCQLCDSPLRFAHASMYLQNVIDESACCSACGQSAPDRRYSLN